MKMALCTDLHFGHRKGNDVFLESQMRFFYNQFIPYLKKNNIKDIGMLGDIFDNRVHVNTKVFKQVHELFNVALKDFNVYIFPGNHDLYYTSTTDVHSLFFLKEFANVTVIEKEQVVKVGTRDIFMCPWQVDEDEFVKVVSEIQNVDLCFGHFEITGFDMFKNKPCEHGLPANIFYEKFLLTISGHFHTKSSRKRNNSEILYMGNAYHMTRNDIGDARGFTVLDLETLEYEFIENTESIRYVSLVYPQKITEMDVKNNSVDVVVSYDENYNEEAVQNYLHEIESYGPAFPPHVRMTNKFISSVDCNSVEMLSVQDLMREYVDELDVPNKDRLYTLLMRLYTECKSE